MFSGSFAGEDAEAWKSQSGIPREQAIYKLVFEMNSLVFTNYSEQQLLTIS